MTDRKQQFEITGYDHMTFGIMELRLRSAHKKRCKGAQRLHLEYLSTILYLMLRFIFWTMLRSNHSSQIWRSLKNVTFCIFRGFFSTFLLAFFFFLYDKYLVTINLKFAELIELGNVK